MDNQRLLTWGAFGLLLFFTYQTWMQDYGPRPVPPAAEQAQTEAPPLVEEDALPELDATDEKSLPEPDRDLPVEAGRPGDTAATIRVRTDVLDVEISTRGGSLVRATMLDYPVAKDQPDTLVQLLSPEGPNYGSVRAWLRGTEDGPATPDFNAVYRAASNSYELGDRERIVVVMNWAGEDGITVEKRYVFTRGSYAIGLEHEIVNQSAREWRGDQVVQIRGRSREPDRSMFDVDSYSFDGPLTYDGNKAEKLKRGELLRKGPVRYETADGWVASIEHHFLRAIVPARGEPATYQVQISGDTLIASAIGAPQSLAAGERLVFERALFVGPKLQTQLEVLHPRLKLSVDYGWLTILSQPMFWLLSKIYAFVGNWGVAIILVTLVIKLVFYKLTETSGRSMAKMRNLQPRMKALQERYKDDRTALSQAMMDLYKREGVNPAAGCLPILVQMPFFLAFYWVLVESVEMRQAPFVFWLTDLSARDPYFILPLIMGAAMLLQQKLNPAPTDPVQARVMQIMPIVFTAFFAFFPSGLVLYWLTNTILSIAQQWKINKVVEAEAKQQKDRGKKTKEG